MKARSEPIAEPGETRAAKNGGEWGRRTGERLAALLHLVHGTRGLSVALPLLLLLALVEPLLPAAFPHIVIVAPLFALLLASAATLPREGVAAQARAKALMDDEAANTKLLLRLAWPGLLVIVLSPRIFLAALGIPHLSPLAGLVTPSVLQRAATVFLLATMLLPLVYLRSTWGYARHIEPVRPKFTEQAGFPPGSRDALLAFTVLLAVTWAWLLEPFWRPFTLFDWPPSLDSLASGPRGLARLTFTLLVPLPLLMTLSAHLALLHELWLARRLREQADLATLAGLHVGLTLVAVALHAYDALWVVRYHVQSAL